MDDSEPKASVVTSDSSIKSDTTAPFTHAG